MSASNARHVAGARPVTIRGGELARSLVGGERGDHVVEVAGEDIGEAVDREPDAVIGEPILLEVVGADLLAPAAATDLGAPLHRQGGVTFALGELEQAGPQHLHGAETVLQLAALVLHRDHGAGRQVRHAHRRVGGVHALAAGPLERYTSIWRSLSSICTSSSSASGSTSTVADDVWMRPWLSVTGTRCTR